jgi:hypothetical protein
MKILSRKRPENMQQSHLKRHTIMQSTVHQGEKMAHPIERICKAQKQANTQE